MKNRRIFSLTEDQYHDMENNMVGLCLACGEERFETEPDARHYDCHECEAYEVFGVPELLMMDRIDIED